MPLRILLVTLALTLTALAHAQGNRTLTCTTNLQTQAACFIEQTLFTIGPIEISIGVQTQIPRNSYIAPYAVIAYYSYGLSAFMEFSLPTVTGAIGKPDPFRFGFSWRF